jgi:hypothetical protein
LCPNDSRRESAMLRSLADVADAVQDAMGPATRMFLLATAERMRELTRGKHFCLAYRTELPERMRLASVTQLGFLLSQVNERVSRDRL